MQKILVVDDDPEILSFLKTYLEAHRFDVYLASTAGAGLRLARERMPDLVILDVMMPDAGGLTVYNQMRTVRGADRPTPVLVFSAAPSFLIHGKIAELPKEDIIPKTENIGELLEAIQKRLPPA